MGELIVKFIFLRFWILLEVARVTDSCGRGSQSKAASSTLLFQELVSTNDLVFFIIARRNCPWLRGLLSPCRWHVSKLAGFSRVCRGRAESANCMQKKSRLVKTPIYWQLPKRFSTSKDATAELHFQAAPEIDFDDKPSETAKPARIVPASPSYFTASPQLNDNVLLLRSLLQRFEFIPTISPDQAPRVAWLKLSQYRTKVGEPVTASKYAKILLLLGRLNRIHPQLRAQEIRDVIEQFRRPGSAELQKPKVQKLDEYGRAKGIGRRKESSARVYLVEGTGEVLINGKSILQAFPRLHDRESVLWALKATQRMDKYNVWALVEGGGVTGQAESITLALARALMVHEPALKPALRRGDLAQCHIVSIANRTFSWNGNFG